MTEPLGALFEQFIKERVYLKAVTPKTRIWYQTAFKAFQAAPGENFSKQRLQAFVVSLRERGVKPRSVNTYLQAMNAFGLWLHQEKEQPLVHLGLLRTENKILVTYTEPQLKQLLGFKPRTFNHWRIHALVNTILDTGCRIDEPAIDNSRIRAAVARSNADRSNPPSPADVKLNSAFPRRGTLADISRAAVFGVMLRALQVSRNMPVGLLLN